jgi:hypothetical protein
VVELPPWYDVDDAAALQRLLQETAKPASASFSAGDGLAPYAAPFTAAALARIGLPVTGLDLAAE